MTVSQLLFNKERRERFARGHSFLKATRANRSRSLFKESSFEGKSQFPTLDLLHGLFLYDRLLCIVCKGFYQSILHYSSVKGRAMGKGVGRVGVGWGVRAPRKML